MFEKFVAHPFVCVCTFNQSWEISYQDLGKQVSNKIFPTSKNGYFKPSTSIIILYKQKNPDKEYQEYLFWETPFTSMCIPWNWVGDQFSSSSTGVSASNQSQQRLSRWKGILSFSMLVERAVHSCKGELRQTEKEQYTKAPNIYSVTHRKLRQWIKEQQK